MDTDSEVQIVDPRTKNLTEIEFTDLDLEIHSTEKDEQKKAIISAAKRGDSVELDRLLANVTNSEYLMYCEPGTRRNVLHWACDAGNPNDALKCFRVIMRCFKKCVDHDEEVATFLDQQDAANETALHISIKNFCSEITNKLIKQGADLEIKSNEKWTQIQLMCKYSRKAIKNEMDDAINYIGKSKRCSVCQDPEMREKYSFCLHFASLIPYDSERIEDILEYDYKNEMEILHFFSNAGLRARKEVFSHPLLKCFLHLKWKKMQTYILSFMIYYVIWLSLHLCITTTIYVHLCPLNNSTDEVHGCDLGGSYTFYLTVVVMFAASVIPLLVELLQMVILKTAYFHDLKNYAQIFIILQVGIQMFCFTLNTHKFARIFASMAVLCGVFLLLSQLDQFPGFFKHVRYLKTLFTWINFNYFEIFRNLLKKLCFLLIPFMLLLYGFNVAFHILLPQMDHFSLSFKSYVKFMALATSQLSYDETFKDEEIKAEMDRGTLTGSDINLAMALYAVFLVVVVLVWFNFLIGVTVDDIKVEGHNAEVNNISNRIAKLYVMESLIVYLARYCKYMQYKLEEISISNRHGPPVRDEEAHYHVHKSELPKNIIQDMRELIERRRSNSSATSSRNFNISDENSSFSSRE